MFFKCFRIALFALFFNFASHALSEDGGKILTNITTGSETPVLHPIQSWVVWGHSDKWEFTSKPAAEFTPTSTEWVTRFEIPKWGEKDEEKPKFWPTFLVSSNVTPVLHPLELRGKSLQAIFQGFNGAKEYAYGSYGQAWNKHPKPAFVKLFFATEEYDLDKSSDTKWDSSSKFWWSDTTIALDSGVVQVIQENFDPQHWTDGMSRRGSDVIHLWLQAVRNMKYVGIAFSGGQHYDMGIANPEISGEFQLLGFFEAEEIPASPTNAFTALVGK